LMRGVPNIELISFGGMSTRSVVQVVLSVVLALSLTGCGGGGGCVPETPLSKLLRCTLLRSDADGKKENLVLDEALKGKSNIAIFFGGSWCPFTAAFVDGLFLKTIEKVKARNPDDTEVVLLWASRNATRPYNEKLFEEWIKGKPWLSVPFATSMGYDGETALGVVRKSIREAEGRPDGILAEKYGAMGVPTVVVLGQDGEIKYQDFVAFNYTAYDEGWKSSALWRFFNETNSPPSWLEVQAEVEDELMMLETNSPPSWLEVQAEVEDELMMLA